jgi:hypothetical protein
MATRGRRRFTRDYVTRLLRTPIGYSGSAKIDSSFHVVPIRFKNTEYYCTFPEITVQGAARQSRRIRCKIW